MKTIKQLADELGISKTAVRKYFTADFREKYTQTNEKNTILISETGCKLITESLRKVPENSENKFPQTSENLVFADIIATLRAELDIKNKQIEDLSTALAAAQQTAAQAQALHAGTIKKMLEAPKPNIIKRIFGGKKSGDSSD